MDLICKLMRTSGSSLSKVGRQLPLKVGEFRPSKETTLSVSVCERWRHTHTLTVPFEEIMKY